MPAHMIVLLPERARTCGVALAWAGGAPNLGYNVSLRIASSSSLVSSQVVTVTYIAYDNLTPNTSYVVQIATINEVGLSAPLTTLAFTTEGKPTARASVRAGPTRLGVWGFRCPPRSAMAHARAPEWGPGYDAHLRQREVCRARHRRSPSSSSCRRS